MRKKIIKILLISFVFTSCNNYTDLKNENLSLNYLFNQYGDQIDEEILLINQMITLKKKSYNGSDKAHLIKIDSLINDYFSYLEYVVEQSNAAKKNIFFDNDNLTDEGRAFLVKNNTFLKETQLLLNDPNLNKLVYYKFNTDDVRNADDIFFDYMEYNYLDIPYSVFKFLIKKKKRDLFLLNNEIWNK